ncbi:MAG: hypothetical protein EOO61_22990, partial [Hymenobacter sp.]
MNSQQDNRFDHESDDTSKHESAFECNICLETAKDAVVSMCGHLFCWPCLYQWMYATDSNTQSHKTCPVCNGARLKKESLHFKIDGKNIFELSDMDISSLKNWYVGIEERLSERQNTIAKEVLKEIRARLGFLTDVGLNYLSLDRTARTLSGGEAQRIRLATQIGSQLMNVMYILDEPSIGLHQRDNERLIGALKNLRDLG